MGKIKKLMCKTIPVIYRPSLPSRSLCINPHLLGVGCHSNLLPKRAIQKVRKKEFKGGGTWQMLAQRCDQGQHKRC